jgi:hypothetical protein
MGIPGRFRGVFSFKFSVFSGEQPNRRRSSVAWRPRLLRNGSRIGNRASRMPAGLPQLGLGTRHSKQGRSGWDGFHRLKPGLHTPADPLGIRVAGGQRTQSPCPLCLCGNSEEFSVFSGEQPNRRRSSVAWRPRLLRIGSRIGNRGSRMPAGLPQLGLGTRHSKQGRSGWDGFRRLKPGLHTLRTRSVSGWPRFDADEADR